MKIYIGTDHAGFELKQALVAYLKELEYEVEDLGAHKYNEMDDYPDFIAPVARAVASSPDQNRGIILGGSGQGEAILANKFSGVRATVCYGPPFEIVRLSREHNDANILSLGARFITEDEAKEAIKLWLETDFSGEERHVRRIKKIDDVQDEFDRWSIIKKQIDTKSASPFFKSRDIFFMKVGKNIGYEENGKGNSFRRPVLVLKKFNKDVFWGIPFSTTKKKGDYYFHFSFIKNKESAALLSQVRLFDARRLIHKKGMINKDDYGLIKQKISNLLRC